MNTGAGEQTGPDVYCRDDGSCVVLGLQGRQEVQFRRFGDQWGFDGLYVRTGPDFFKQALSTRNQPSFLGGPWYDSLATSRAIDRDGDSVTARFEGENARPVPHRLGVRFTATKGSPFLRRIIEFAPLAPLDLGPDDLCFTLKRAGGNKSYFAGRMILGQSPRVSETVEAPRWYPEPNVQAFSKEVNLDLLDTMGLPGIVAVFRGMVPFCLVYLKELPADDLMRHFVARENMNEEEVGATSTRGRVEVGEIVRETSYWNLFCDPTLKIEDLIPLATAAYWDMVEPFPEHKLDALCGWMAMARNVEQSLFRPKAFGANPPADDDPLKGWTGYTVEESARHANSQGTPATAIQYWGDYAFRFSRLKGQESFQQRLDPLLENSLRYIRGDTEWAKRFWDRWEAPCLSFFDVERMRCGLPLAAHWEDGELFDLFKARIMPFVKAGTGFLEGWREDALRREREHATLSAAYYNYFPGEGWAYAAAGVFALASEMSAYDDELRSKVRETVVAMVRRLNGELGFGDMSHYIPHNIGLLPLSWSVYANARAHEFSGEQEFLEAGRQRMHWVLSMGNFREVPDDRRSCRTVLTDRPDRPDFRWHRMHPRLETVGWLNAGTHERWNAPSEMWQAAFLIAPVADLTLDLTALRFLALARKSMLQVFPGNTEAHPKAPLWIPFEFPLSRKDKEQYGTGPFFQLAMTFEAFADPDNPRVLAFSPTTLYGERLTDRPRVRFVNVSSRPQTFDPGFKDYGSVRIRAEGQAEAEAYDGGRLALEAGESLSAAFAGD